MILFMKVFHVQQYSQIVRHGKHIPLLNKFNLAFQESTFIK